MTSFPAMDEVICACLSRVYDDHAARTDRLTCKLEHALPIRHSFFRLKRVPHFQTRDDLHSEHTPAYLPIYRLENASLESLSQKTKAGCRRVLIEGDLGTGKTLVCQRLLHEWAKAMQFFRHVQINQPFITVACEERPTTAGHQDPKSHHRSKQPTNKDSGNGGDAAENSANSCSGCDKAELEDDDICELKEMRPKRRTWNMQAIGGHKSDVVKTESLPQQACNRSSWHSDFNTIECSNNNASRETTSVCRNDDEASEQRSRRALFVQQKVQGLKVSLAEVERTDSKSERSDSKSERTDSKSEPADSRSERTDSRSPTNNRKSSRSRSNGDADRGNIANKKRNKAFDGIPQKYLSLLNIGSPGEGSFESPSRNKSLRESKRQRPSRLTSNLTDYKAMIYIPCVRMALSELLAKCNNARVRHYYVAAVVLLDLLTLSNVPHNPIPFDCVYHWILANRQHICVIFDNVDGSEAWARLIADAFHDRDGFGKMIAASTPGRISKCDVDSLFYCYGLSNEYSNKILLSRLRNEAPHVVDRISFLLTSNHTQELLCNPLSLSLLAAYLRSVKEDDEIPEHLSELLENLIRHAMASENNSVQNISKGRRQRFSLQSVCETVAFECLENDTNYFSKQKFPQQFWTRHLCDCRVLHEVHEIANFTSIHPRPLSPTVNLAITPDSDSVHSSASSNFDITLPSDLCASNNSLCSTGDQEGSKPEPEFLTPLPGKAVALLQVPILHASNDLSRKNPERPKSLTLDGRKQTPVKTVQTTQTSGEIVSFTSRCIRDYLASKRVCRYLQSDRDSESFIERLIAKPQFYPVLRLTVRNLYISDRSDLILNLLDMLLTSQELGFQGHFTLSTSPTPRGPSPTSFGDPQLLVRLPHRYRISNSDCPFRVKREEQKQRRSSTSILGTCFENSTTLRTSQSFNRLLINTSSLSSYSTSSTPENTRGYLEDFKEALIWLAETDNSEPYIGAVSNRFPDTLVVSYHECPLETIDHFICLTKRSVPAVKEVVLYLSGFYAQWELGMRLAEALQELTNLTTLRVSMKCVVDTSFLVDFLCECFENNCHIETLSLEGPMNVAENLSPAEHKRVQQVFSDPRISLKTLVLDHFSYHHRIGYILSSWPNVLRNLKIKKSTIDSAAEKISDKLSACPELSSLTLENCFLPTSSLQSIVDHILTNVNILQLTTLELTILSSSRKFSKTDTKKPFFKPAISMEVCKTLAEMVRCSPVLKHLLLSYNGLLPDKGRLILQAVVYSPALATLDLTGNLLGDAIQDDVLLVLSQALQLKSLQLADNGVTKETRSAVIRKSLSRHDLRLSL